MKLDFFINDKNSTGLIGSNPNLALAICYELSVPKHSEDAFNRGAEIYVASVAKNANGVEKAIKNLSEIGKKYSMTVLMSNCIGQSGGYECGGKSSIWNKEGALLGQLDDSSEGILIIDTKTNQIFEKTIPGDQSL